MTMTTTMNNMSSAELQTIQTKYQSLFKKYGYLWTKLAETDPSVMMEFQSFRSSNHPDTTTTNTKAETAIGEVVVDVRKDEEEYIGSPHTPPSSSSSIIGSQQPTVDRISQQQNEFEDDLDQDDTNYYDDHDGNNTNALLQNHNDDDDTYDNDNDNYDDDDHHHDETKEEHPLNEMNLNHTIITKQDEKLLQPQPQPTKSLPIPPSPSPPKIYQKSLLPAILGQTTISLRVPSPLCCDIEGCNEMCAAPIMEEDDEEIDDDDDDDDEEEEESQHSQLETTEYEGGVWVVDVDGQSSYTSGSNIVDDHSDDDNVLKTDTTIAAAATSTLTDTIVDDTHHNDDVGARTIDQQRNLPSSSPSLYPLSSSSSSSSYHDNHRQSRTSTTSGSSSTNDSSTNGSDSSGSTVIAFDLSHLTFPEDEDNPNTTIKEDHVEGGGDEHSLLLSSPSPSSYNDLMLNMSCLNITNRSIRMTPSQRSIQSFNSQQQQQQQNHTMMDTSLFSPGGQTVVADEEEGDYCDGSTSVDDTVVRSDLTAMQEMNTDDATEMKHLVPMVVQQATDSSRSPDIREQERGLGLTTTNTQEDTASTNDVYDRRDEHGTIQPSTDDDNDDDDDDDDDDDVESIRSDVGTTETTKEKVVSLDVPKAADIRNSKNKHRIDDSLMMTQITLPTTPPSCEDLLLNISSMSITDHNDKNLNAIMHASNSRSMMSPGPSIITSNYQTPSLFSPGGQTVVPEGDESNNGNDISESAFDADGEMNNTFISEASMNTHSFRLLQTRLNDTQENMGETITNGSSEEKGNEDGTVQSTDDIDFFPNVVDVCNDTDDMASMMNDSLMATPRHPSGAFPRENRYSNSSGLMMSPAQSIIPSHYQTPSLFSPGGQTVVPEEDEGNSVNGISRSEFDADGEMNNTLSLEGSMSGWKGISEVHNDIPSSLLLQARLNHTPENMEETVSHSSDEEKGNEDGMIQSTDDIDSTADTKTTNMNGEYISSNIPNVTDVRNHIYNMASMMNENLMATPVHPSGTFPRENRYSNSSGLMMSPAQSIIPSHYQTPSLFSPGGQTVVPEEDEGNSVNGISRSAFDADGKINDTFRSEGSMSGWKGRSETQTDTLPSQFIQTRLNDSQEGMDDDASHSSSEERGDEDDTIQSTDEVNWAGDENTALKEEHYLSPNILKTLDVRSESGNMESETNDSFMTAEHLSPTATSTNESREDIELDMSSITFTGQTRTKKTVPKKLDESSTNSSEEEAEWTDKDSENESSAESVETNEPSYEVIILSDDESEEESMSNDDEEEEFISEDEETSDEEEVLEEENREGSQISSSESQTESKDMGNNSVSENVSDNTIEIHSDDSDETFQISTKPDIKKQSTATSKIVQFVIDISDESDDSSIDSVVMSPLIENELKFTPLRDFGYKSEDNYRIDSRNSTSKGKSSSSGSVVISPYVRHENELTPYRDDCGKENYRIGSLNSESKGKSSSSNFKRERVYLTQRLFNSYDSKVFNNALKDVEVKWSPRLLKTAGLTRLKNVKSNLKKLRVATIELSTKVIDEEVRLRSTLLHEMCHAAAWLVDGVHKPPHGPCFKKWSNLAMRQVKDVIVSTTHDYAITYKFAWACSAKGCSFIVKRHSRSVDIEKHLCGYCKGKLIEIEVPGSTRDVGSTGYTPKKKRNATGFSLYIKEHAGEVRRRMSEKRGVLDPTVTQPDVMKECGRLWREMKNQNV